MAEDAPVVVVRPAAGLADIAWLRALWRGNWGGDIMVIRERVVRVDDVAALIAWRGGDRAGAATYLIDGDVAELVSLNAVNKGQGVGSALLAAVEDAARNAGARRLRVITTNDNLDALRYYQRRGFRLTHLSSGAVDAARAVKPSIPLIGDHGIPIHDEIQLEKGL